MSRASHTRSTLDPRSRFRLPMLAFASAVVFLLTGRVHAGPSPTQQCAAGKNRAAGAYAACRANAEAKLATTGNAAKLADALAVCAAKLGAAWGKLEAKAARAGATCLDGSGTTAAFATVIDAHSGRIATALAGDGLQACGNGTVEVPEQCDGPLADGVTCTTAGAGFGPLRCGSGCTFDTSACSATRFTDGGDGTVIDHQTGLQWEKKVSPGEGTLDPHDVDNLYSWGDLDGCPFRGCANGTAFSDFLLRLNDCYPNGGTFPLEEGGFAGHCDWRLPTLTELRGIIDVTASGCGLGSPCIDPIFGPTIPDAYWTAIISDVITPGSSDPTGAYDVYFYNGLFTTNVKTLELSVRAVRTLR